MNDPAYSRKTFWQKTQFEFPPWRFKGEIQTQFFKRGDLQWINQHVMQT